MTNGRVVRRARARLPISRCRILHEGGCVMQHNACGGAFVSQTADLDCHQMYARLQ